MIKELVSTIKERSRLFQDESDLSSVLQALYVDYSEVINYLLSDKTDAQKEIILADFISILQTAQTEGIDLKISAKQADIIKRKVGNVFRLKLELRYGGLLSLINRKAKITSLNAQVVFAKDDFKADYGVGEIRHLPNLFERSEVVAAYAQISIDGFQKPFLSILTKEEILKRRTPNSMIWDKFFEEMAKKTAIKSCCKYILHCLGTSLHFEEFSYDEKPIENERRITYGR